MKVLTFLMLGSLLIAGCKSKTEDPAVFGTPVKVTVSGYSGNLMEPFITRDGAFLLFNNLNAPPENTNLHFAAHLSDTEFEYKGEVNGVNTPDLEGTPSMDNSGNLYFISTRSYATTFSTIYRATFSNGNASGVALLDGISKNQAPFVNFDVEVSAAGDYLYFVDSEFDASNNPTTADLVIAKKSGTGFARLANSADLLTNVNTNKLEYAPGISTDGLELFFTRVDAPLTSSSSSQIFVATRQSTDAAFDTAILISVIEGFVEGPSISADGKRLYFHKKDDGKFGIWLTRR